MHCALHNPFGMLWLVDTGNNRLQLYDENGRVKKVFGEDKPTIVDKWFKKGRGWYVSGAPAVEKGGAFVNPVDLVFIPKKKDIFQLNMHTIFQFHNFLNF